MEVAREILDGHGMAYFIDESVAGDTGPCFLMFSTNIRHVAVPLSSARLFALYHIVHPGSGAFLTFC